MKLITENVRLIESSMIISTEKKHVKYGDARTARGRTCIRCLTRSFFVHFHEKFLRALLVQIDDEEIALAQIRLAVDARWRARI